MGDGVASIGAAAPSLELDIPLILQDAKMVVGVAWEFVQHVVEGVGQTINPAKPLIGDLLVVGAGVKTSAWLGKFERFLERALIEPEALGRIVVETGAQAKEILGQFVNA